MTHKTCRWARRALVMMALVEWTVAGTYKLSTSTKGSDFYTDFSWQAIPDPTHGRVNYVDLDTAKSTGLAQAVGDAFFMYADSTTTLSASGPGRNAQRIMSNKAYGTHVAIVDVGHMPQALATWPAFWELGAGTLPYGSEIDIIEGVNDVVPNQSTLHTGPGCTMPSASGAQTGKTVSTDCDAFDNSNAGCGVQTTSTSPLSPGSSLQPSYGPPFNRLGGGIYAMEKTPTSIKVWFWARDDPFVPPDVLLAAVESIVGEGSVDTGEWGTPVANWGDGECDIASAFSEMNIIINLTFCGDWAGAVFNEDGGTGDCDTYVNENPSAFAEAFWEINYVNVYE